VLWALINVPYDLILCSRQGLEDNWFFSIDYSCSTAGSDSLAIAQVVECITKRTVRVNSRSFLVHVFGKYQVLIAPSYRLFTGSCFPQSLRMNSAVVLSNSSRSPPSKSVSTYHSLSSDLIWRTVGSTAQARQLSNYERIVRPNVKGCYRLEEVSRT